MGKVVIMNPIFAQIFKAHFGDHLSPSRKAEVQETGTLDDTPTLLRDVEPCPSGSQGDTELDRLAEHIANHYTGGDDV